MPERFSTRVDDAITRVAQGAHGVVDGAHLPLGFGNDALARRSQARILRREAKGIYVHPGHEDRWTPLAVLEARIPRSVAWGRTAAALTELDAFDRPARAVLWRPDLLVPPGSRIGDAGIHAMRVARADISSVQGLRVLAPAALLLSLGAAPEVTLDDLEAATEDLIRRGAVTDHELRARLAVPATREPRGWRRLGRARLGQVLARRQPGEVATGSYAETLCLQRVLRPAGITVRRPPARGRARETPHRPLRRPARACLLLKVDGAAAHATRIGHQRDVSRDLAARLSGRHVERITWDDVTVTPRHTARLLVHRLGQLAARAS